MAKHRESNEKECVVACYKNSELFLEAAKAAKYEKLTHLEAYSPYPVEGLSEILELKERVLPWLVFCGGCVGAVTGFMMQYIANVWDMPLNIGGRPYNSWPAFIPITFELTILFAALFAIIGFILRCRLPQIYHPAFDIPGFERATLDHFFLCIWRESEEFDAERIRKFFKTTKAEGIYVLGGK